MKYSPISKFSLLAVVVILICGWQKSSPSPFTIKLSPAQIRYLYKYYGEAGLIYDGVHIGAQKNGDVVLQGFPSGSKILLHDSPAVLTKDGEVKMWLVRR